MRKKSLNQSILRKKISAIFLATALIVTSFPAFSVEVHAAELPDINQFATKEELKSFNTNDNDGSVNPAKVYFGKGRTGSVQQWWVAGSQNGNLTLFATSPLAVEKQFEPDKYNDKEYSIDWNCDYISTGCSVPTEVHPNHYGASPLRKTLKEMETGDIHFSKAEKVLMNDTTIYTADTKNNSVYSTTDKLYFAHGDGGNNYITVGANSAGSLKDGLRIDSGYWWGNSNYVFWLRTPNERYSDYVEVARVVRQMVEGSGVNNTKWAVLPAFELNLSAVLFASVAPAALSDGALGVSGDTMTFRYKGRDLGSAVISSESKVDLTGVPAGIYLVAQNKDGVWAKKITNETSISASEMGNGFTDFSNCKVWLEQTVDSERKTYANMAKFLGNSLISVMGNRGLTITSGNEEQEVPTGSAIGDIIVKADRGYYFSDAYVTELSKQLDGLQAEKVNDDFTLRISGTPQSDVEVVLPDAVKLTDVEIVLGTGMQVQSGDLKQQLKENQSMTDIVIEANSDYIFPADYSVTGQNGITVTRDSDSQITVSGTPTADTVLTLPAATQKVYGMELSGEGNFGSKCVGYAPVTATEFTIINRGGADLTNVQVSVIGADSGSFTLTWNNSVTSIQPNDTIKFTVRPDDGLRIENYQVELSVSADNCNTVTVNLQFEVKDHVYQETVTQPTCAQKGFTTHTCQNCGDEYKDDETEMVSHKFVNYVSNHDATCTQDGTKTATCEYGCGNTNTLPDDGSRLEHDYEWIYNNDEACEKNGTETGICKNCQQKTTREKAGTALEHKPSEWITDQATTEATDGKRHKECTVCRKILETETIPATGTPEFEYKILEGENQTYSGSGSLTVRANGNFSKFIGLKVDGNVVDASNYDARTGSTIVTLKESYLSTLPAGDHILTFVYNDGEVSTNFATTDGGTSEAPEKPADPVENNPDTGNRTDSDTNRLVKNNNRSPETGDKTNGSLYLLLFIMSGLMIAFCTKRKRTEN